jgi:hypothetical protein
MPQSARLSFAALALAALCVPASAALIMHRDLSMDVAVAIAQGAVNACTAKGYPESAVVVDRDGDTIVERSDVVLRTAMRGHDDTGPMRPLLMIRASET